MKRLVAIFFTLFSIHVTAADDRSGVLNTLEQAHQSKDWATVMAVYRSNKTSPEIKAWFLKKGKTGHPMYLLEQANDELASGKAKSATMTALNAYISMTADIAICMNPQAKQLALQHMGSYKDLNMYFNSNLDATLKAINELVKGEKSKGDDFKPSYDDTWVCSLVQPAGQMLPAEQQPKMKKMAILTYLITTKSAIELTSDLVSQDKSTAQEKRR